ncbi:GNAT family N-acetyltransferase [Sunxiuqinia sp. A32]|uniref:GNAT family N-acetyltransferase n=1 Tax=Sunxiuqinia sp. A32 TaxID=3461496 RepID=UPI0040462D8D
MIIREAIPQDAPDIIDFQQKMALETENIELDTDIITNGVHAVFKDSTKGKYYVAEINGKVVASLLTTFEWSDWRDGTILWIQSVFVLKDFRQKGIYRNMYMHIRDLVDNHPNLKGIRLYADKSNTDAHQVYQKMGMDADHYQLYEWLKNE